MNENSIASANVILLEYMRLLREQQTLQSNILTSYNQTIFSSNEALRTLMQRNYNLYELRNRRLIEQQRNNTNINTTRTNNNITDNTTDNTNRRSVRSTRRWYDSFNRRWNENNTNYQPYITRNGRSLNTSRTSRTSRNFDFSPIRNTSIRYSSRTIPRTVQQIFEESFNIRPPVLNPTLSNDRIHEITTPVLWRDISNADQIICPFTQEEFTNVSNILRINSCGHLFTNSYLQRFFRRYGYRCPVCRADQRDIENRGDVANQPIGNSTNNTLNRNEQGIRNMLSTPISSLPVENTVDRVDNLISTTSNTTDTLNTTDTANTTDTTTNTDTPINEELTPLMENLFRTPEMNDIMNSVSNVITNSFTEALENQSSDNSGNSIMFDFQTIWSNPVNNSTSNFTSNNTTNEFT